MSRVFVVLEEFPMWDGGDVIRGIHTSLEFAKMFTPAVNFRIEEWPMDSVTAGKEVW